MTFSITINKLRHSARHSACQGVIMLSVILLSIIMQNFTYKPLNAYFRYAECRGALILIVMKGKASHYAGHFVD